MRLSLNHLLLAAVLTLLAMSLVMIYSSSAIMADVNYHDSAYFLKRQTIFVGMGLAAMLAGALIDTSLFRKWSYAIYGVSIALLIIVLIPGVGRSAGGAARWVGFGGFHLQAGEVFKFALVLYLAMSLAKKGKSMQLFRIGIVPHVVLPGIAIALLLLEPDFGTAFMVATVTFVMLFVGGARVAYLVAGVACAIPIAVHFVAQSPYRLGRVIAFLDPWAHRQDVGYQVVESLITLGSGGLTGVGLGSGPSKLFFLPAARTDFILAVIGEELGFLGVTLIIMCFVVIAYVGLKTALSTKSPYHLYLATGITSMLVLQAIFNALVVVGLVPTKGITLPFVSYGGSSVIVSCFMAGALLRLNQSQDEDEDEDDEEEEDNMEKVAV